MMTKRNIRNQLAPARGRVAKRLSVSGASSRVKLPAADAGFQVWGEAAHALMLEYREAWHRNHQNPGDCEFQKQLAIAEDLVDLAYSLAYPPRFWETMPALLAGKSVDLEPFISYLEADPYCFRSGYIKSKTLRGLKRASMSPAQRLRLQYVVLCVDDKGFRREFRDYCRLARFIYTPGFIADLESRLNSFDPNRALRAKWVIDACLKP